MNVSDPKYKQQNAFNEALAQNRRYLENSRREYENKMDSKEASHVEHVDKLRKSSEDEKVEMVRDYKNDVDRQSEQFKDILYSTHERKRKDMEQQREDFNFEREKTKFSFQRQLDILQKSFERALEAKQDELDGTKERAAKNMEFVKKEHANEIQDIVTSYEDRFKKIKQGNEKKRWENLESKM